jgi:hypothetical protein
MFFVIESASFPAVMRMNTLHYACRSASKRPEFLPGCQKGEQSLSRFGVFGVLSLFFPAVKSFGTKNIPLFST